MGTRAAICALATAAGIGIALTGCGSDGGKEETSSASSSSTSSSAASTTAAPETSATAAPDSTTTIAEYLSGLGVTQELLKRGAPGAPDIDLPMPDGWEDVGPDTPADAYGAIVLTAAKQTPNPPAIIARLARIDGEVDTAKLLEYAPNAVKRTPGWDGPATGEASTLGGFEAVQIAGTAEAGGAPIFVARKTVVIPGTDNVFLLALDAQGALDQQDALMAAMGAIDQGTTITP